MPKMIRLFCAPVAALVAVANALPTVKENADFVVANHGAGVAELAKLLIETDLSDQQIGVREIQPVIGEFRGLRNSA